jgi:hypothetical protein
VVEIARDGTIRILPFPGAQKPEDVEPEALDGDEKIEL